MMQQWRRAAMMVPMAAALTVGTALTMPAAQADNRRLNDSVIANVYTVQHQAGCVNDVKKSPQLQLAAEWHTRDVLSNRALGGDIGSDGSTPQDRANNAGYGGQVAQTVAINLALAISGIELINQWYYNPSYFAIMADCAHTEIGVWSENSLDRTVVVAVYGKPSQQADTPETARESGPAPGGPALANHGALDPAPDYDASDEVEYGLNWLPWILRGVYPPPAYPPQ